MNRYLVILIVIIFFSNTNISAQLNLPLKFKSIESKWAELCWMRDTHEDNQWFDHRVSPLIVDDTIYTFMNYRHNVVENGATYGYCGYSIKKLNKSNGNLYWETQRLYKNYLQRKVISQPLIIGSKMFVTLYDEAISSGTEWSQCFPAHIVLDISSGLVIDSNYVNKSDQTLPKFYSIDESPSVRTTVNSRFYMLNEGYRHRALANWFNPNVNLGVIQYDLDDYGKITDSDTFKIEYPYLFSEFIFFDNDLGGINGLLASEENNWSKKEIRFLKLDAKLKALKSIDISHYFTDTIQSFALTNTDNRYSIVTTSYESPTLKTLRINFHLLNSEGHLIDKMHFTLYPNKDTGIRYGWLYPLIDTINKRILVSQSRQNNINESTFFDLFVGDRDSIKRIQSIEVDGIQDHFRTQFGTMMDNGDILLYIAQFDWIEPDVRWYSWIMLDGQNMNIISNTKDEPSVDNKLKLFPNPTSRIVKIDNLEAPSSVIISNINGHVWKTSYNVINEIDLSDLPAGMYILDIKNKEISESHKIVKVE